MKKICRLNSDIKEVNRLVFAEVLRLISDQHYIAAAKSDVKIKVQVQSVLYYSNMKFKITVLT